MSKKRFIAGVGTIVSLLFLIMVPVSLAFAAAGAPDNSIESKPYTADAAEPGAVPAQTELPSMGWYLAKMVFSLGLIGGLAYGAMRLFPRKLNLLPGGDYISVYDQYYFGPNKGVYIAEIGGKVMALGVTEQNISVLGEISDEALIRDMRENHLTKQTGGPPARDGVTPFSTHIRQQILKLQDIAQGKVNKTDGKDDHLE